MARPDTTVTHWIDWDAPKLGRRAQQRAACGALVRWDTHSMTPTCPACQQARADQATWAFTEETEHERR